MKKMKKKKKPSIHFVQISQLKSILPQSASLSHAWSCLLTKQSWS